MTPSTARCTFFEVRQAAAKSTLLRAFTPTAPKAFWNARSVDQIDEFYQRLLLRGCLGLDGCIDAVGHKVCDQLAHRRVVFDGGDHPATLILQPRGLMQQGMGADQHQDRFEVPPKPYRDRRHKSAPTRSANGITTRVGPVASHVCSACHCDRSISTRLLSCASARNTAAV